MSATYANKHVAPRISFQFMLKRIHLVAKFACLYCTEDFMTNDLLFSHVIKHQIQCSICYEYVLTEADLNQHMLRRHKKELPKKNSSTASK